MTAVRILLAAATGAAVLAAQAAAAPGARLVDPPAPPPPTGVLGPRPVAFGDRIGLSAGPGPSSEAVADLNRDGRMDLVVAGLGDSLVSVLLGDGAGSFASARTFATGFAPHAVAPVDLDGDGNLDLATGNQDGTVSVLLGDGTGSFAPHTDVPVGVYVYGLAAGDLNGDGHVDLVAADPGANALVTLLGDGTGSFSGERTTATVAGPTCVALADLNGDGREDAVAADSGGTSVSVLLGDGTGSFAPRRDFDTGVAPGTGSAPRGVAVADLNGDGRPDLAASNALLGVVSVLLGDGTGSFGPRTDFRPRADVAPGDGPWSVAVGDVNGDGRPDLATADGEGDTVSVLLGDGTGAFGTSSSFATGSGAVGVAAADLDGDGRPDLVTADIDTSGVSLLLNETVANDWSSETTLGADVLPVLTLVAGPASLTFPPLVVGGSATLAAPVSVTSNDPAGYQLSVTRTPFSAGDLPLSIRPPATAADGAALEVTQTTAIPTAGGLALAHRNTVTSGDVWPFELVLGPVPLVRSGHHEATVTWTVVGL